MDNNGTTNNQQINTVLSSDDIYTDEVFSGRAGDPDLEKENVFNQLRHSIAENGIQVPIFVFWDDETKKYKLIDGFRRLKAATLTGRDLKIPAIITNQNPFLVYDILNVLRKSLPVIVRAENLEKFSEAFPSLYQKQKADMVGMSEQSLGEYLKIAQLPEPEKSKARHDNNFTYPKLLKIARITDEVKQKKAFKAYIDDIYAGRDGNQENEEEVAKASSPSPVITDKKRTGEQNKNQTDKAGENNQEGTEAAPQKPRPDYIMIQRNKIENFKKSFWKNVDKWELDEAKQILSDLHGLEKFIKQKIDRLEKKMQEGAVERRNQSTQTGKTTVSKGSEPQQESDPPQKKHIPQPSQYATPPPA